ncbi:hypothetical protein CNMCM6936_003165 [Aspergillus lentulus]|uniref:VOC domain-containing protein n=1 Tax=Aspergillus lentulus TaxID=293939 RepID=A0AAN5YG69_ASPLE|nr:hypothetical protein CNMCM6069_003011 [Aspergillus lentulus]KAF4161702.1 hypothetical protein CNMCM6936_003165 [Aspergillus lentulus]KAF4177836.1 hypothetical protein CNMCM7927_002815 [Aspergillus lentulus]KAF4200604.1 hypothetical protein CNMCM8927_002808 [Aspergillus lentulus]GFG11354.1 hypothetical protein IFM61392_06869 [Aspergillus lentulus]
MFESRSIPLTVDFYTKTLGFELASVKPEDIGSELYFCSLFVGKKTDANFFISKVTPETFKSSHAMIGLGTRELDAYYLYFKSQIRVEFSEDIEDKPWGFQQFTIKDSDGNSFFQIPGRGKPRQRITLGAR